MDHPVIKFAHTYEMYLPDANTTVSQKRGATGNAAVYFETEMGNHMPIALPHLDTNELVNCISKATQYIDKCDGEFTKW